MATHRKSIVRECLDRLDSKMAIGESRRAAKQAVRSSEGPKWSISSGKIHSYKTRSTYQEHSVRFAKWARSEHSIKNLEQLDERANALPSEYLRLHIEQSKSPYTLQAERAALRLFFDNRQLANDVTLPRRTRETITRSRGAAAHDRHFQPLNWQPLIKFLQATGLRRTELLHLRCKDMYRDHSGHVYVHVESGKGGREREVPVLPGRESDVWTIKENRPDDDRAFERIPKHLDVHSYRREFAQALYLYHAPGRTLPPAEGRLKRKDYDRAAAERVTWALGHNRIDVVLRHYIR